jgi:DNA-binding transcriptional regulator YdaS (Cro superfamily)
MSEMTNARVNLPVSNHVFDVIRKFVPSKEFDMVELDASIPTIDGIPLQVLAVSRTRAGNNRTLCYQRAMAPCGCMAIRQLLVEDITDENLIQKESWKGLRLSECHGNRMPKIEMPDPTHALSFFTDEELEKELLRRRGKK